VSSAFTILPGAFFARVLSAPKYLKVSAENTIRDFMSLFADKSASAAIPGICSDVLLNSLPATPGKILFKSLYWFVGKDSKQSIYIEILSLKG